jgi:hypothetical protein
MVVVIERAGLCFWTIAATPTGRIKCLVLRLLNLIGVVVGVRRQRLALSNELN